jgi:hypothetical protein
MCRILDAQDQRVDHCKHLVTGFAGDGGQQFASCPEVVVKRAAAMKSSISGASGPFL